MPHLKIGGKAPAFALPDQHGNTVRLADFLGKYVVIYFYPKALTPGCTLQACSLRDNMDRFRQQGLEVIGISADTSDLLSKFHKKEGLNYALLGDTTHKILEAYGVWEEKSVYGKTFLGVTRTTYLLSPQGIVVAILPKADPATHTEAVLNAFKAHILSTGE
jgi:peroxiredoxin Q/BCP